VGNFAHLSGLSNGTQVRQLDNYTSDGWHHAQKRFLQRIIVAMDQWPQSDWYVLVDDDTFVAPGRLLEELGQYSQPNAQPWYIGFTSTDKDRNLTFNFGGAGIALSNAATKKLRPHLGDGGSCEKHARRAEEPFRQDKFYMAGDIYLGHCLRDLVGVLPTCHPGFSQYGTEMKAIKLNKPEVTRHYINETEMKRWADAQQ
jgi:hypothetical protein